MVLAADHAESLAAAHLAGTRGHGRVRLPLHAVFLSAPFGLLSFLLGDERGHDLKTAAEKWRNLDLALARALAYDLRLR